MGDIFGTDAPMVQSPNLTEMEPLQNQYYAQIAGQSPAAKAQFDYMANQSLANTMQGIGGMKGVRSSQKASMLNSALADQEAKIAGTQAIAAAQEREAAMGNLGSLLMGKAGIQQNVNMFNAQQQTAANDRFARLIGTGLTAGAMAFGGPAAGAATAGMTQGMMNSGANSGNVGMTNSSFFNKNPYQ